jgi:tetratricopeptide (TPR) repeat protein
MKIKLVKKFINNLSLKSLGVLIVSAVLMSSCTPQAEKLYTEAYSEIEAGHFRIAIDLLEKSAALEKNDKKKTKALVEAARIARFEIQDYERAIRINKLIILKSEDSNQRLLAQETMAEIYLENIQNYSQALNELLILEQLTQGLEEKEKLRFKIAQAYFLTGNATASSDYIEASLKSAFSDKKNFLKLKSQILVSQKKYDDALAAFEEIRKADATFFAKENLYISTSVVFEEKEDYASALIYLEKYQALIDDKSYLELRIKRLKEKLTNKPLFKGRRK